MSPSRIFLRLAQVLIALICLACLPVADLADTYAASLVQLGDDVPSERGDRGETGGDGRIDAWGMDGDPDTPLLPGELRAPLPSALQWARVQNLDAAILRSRPPGARQATGPPGLSS